MSSPNGVVARVASAPAARAGWGLPLVVLIVGMFMSILDTSIVNVAIPTLQNEFGVTTDDVQWVITAYTLMLGVVVPASAWLGDRFGLDKLYNVALGVIMGEFAVETVWAAIAIVNHYATYTISINGRLGWNQCQSIRVPRMKSGSSTRSRTASASFRFRNAS